MMNKPLRVWLPAIRVGSGADVFVERLAEGLSRAGHLPRLQWFPHSYEFFPELMRVYVPVKEIDLIHAGSWGGNAFIGMRVPLVTTVLHLVHDPAYAPYRTAAQAIYHRVHVRWREGMAIRASAAITAISDYVAGTVRSVFKRNDVHAIPCWVDLDRYKPVRLSSSEVGRPFRLLMVGNQTKRKGVDLFEDLVKGLGESFELSCTGGLRMVHSRTFHAAGVRFLGRISEQDLIQEYQRCDAVVSLSRYEGFGYTALEGMACGKPFIGFDTSGLSNVVAHGETGMLVPTNDLRALIEACRTLAADAAKCETMGRSARARAVDHFKGEDAIERYVAIYRNVLS
ncbi:glycosyltransferase family 4 protein [Dyella sp. M7H15-1]|uniref:glycosyltransferase family 4 protein n=1 Tax=Dyella sp. M7H15-1 TaxID=2501295 RepID=UPI0013E89C70|nr:glycosyltransferase family 4 protein [Dyella sp. M7H15-1]